MIAKLVIELVRNGERDPEKLRKQVLALKDRHSDSDQAPRRPRHRHRSLPQSSSASRFTAGALGFFEGSSVFVSQPETCGEVGR
jgi:hypothetical protein